MRKYWSLTWETNILQKTIPDEHELLYFLRKHCSDAIFQYEKGTLKEKLHIQGKIIQENHKHRCREAHEVRGIPNCLVSKSNLL